MKKSTKIIMLLMIFLIISLVGIIIDNYSKEKNEENLEKKLDEEIANDYDELVKEDVKNLDFDKSLEDKNIDIVVRKILLDNNEDNYYEGEAKTEGHIILGKDIKDDSAKIYALTMYGNYGFVNDKFEKVSGSGVIPAVITICRGKNNVIEKYEIKYSADGSGYNKSIKEMFPLKYQMRVLSISKKDNEYIKNKEVSMAKEYLKKNGFSAEVGDYFDKKILTDVGVSVEVSNKTLEYKELSKYPMFIGTEEKIENEIRYIYETKYDKQNNEIIYSKYKKENKEVVEKVVIDSLTGDIKK